MYIPFEVLGIYQTNKIRHTHSIKCNNRVGYDACCVGERLFMQQTSKWTYKTVDGTISNMSGHCLRIISTRLVSCRLGDIYWHPQNHSHEWADTQAYKNTKGRNARTICLHIRLVVALYDTVVIQYTQSFVIQCFNNNGLQNFRNSIPPKVARTSMCTMCNGVLADGQTLLVD